MQGVTRATNADNLSAAGRQAVTLAEGPVAFMIRLEVRAILRKEKQKAFMASICFDLKRLYAIEVVAKSYLVRDITQQF